jgi:hypothetical protein
VSPLYFCHVDVTKRNRDYGARSRGIIRVELSLRGKRERLWNLRQWGNGQYEIKTNRRGRT